MKRPLAYITAAWCGSDHENTKLAAQYCRTVYEAGFSPILANYEHKRLHHRLAVIGSVDFQFALCAFMAGDAVQQHHFIQLFIAEVIEINVRAGHGMRGTPAARLRR